MPISNTEGQVRVMARLAQYSGRPRIMSALLMGRHIFGSFTSNCFICPYCLILFSLVEARAGFQTKEVLL